MSKQVNAGLGYLTFVPSGANPTPLVVGVLQDASLEYSSNKVELRGGSQFPVAFADGDAKLSGKAKFAQFDASLLTALVAGSTKATGKRKMVSESGTVSAGAVTVAGSANWIADLGVFDSNGVQLTRVASSPVAGVSYSVASGVYSFNTTDNTVSYTFKYIQSVAGSGSTITIPNSATGISSTYAVKFYNDSAKNGGLVLAAELNAIVFPKLSIPFGASSWTTQDIEFVACEDATGSMGALYLG